MKTVVITLTGIIPDTALSVDAVVTVNGVAYPGRVTGIVTHEAAGGAVPATSTVTLKGTGLIVG